jgi:hypothetical protein
MPTQQRRSRHEERGPLEHRFTDTPDGTQAGTWWARNAVVPWCTWAYDADRSIISVHHGAHSRVLTLPPGAVPNTQAEEHRILPMLALHLTRLMERDR